MAAITLIKDDSPWRGITHSFSNISEDPREGLGEFWIQGKLQLAVWYEEGPQILLVRVHEAEGLVGAKPGGYSDPYVKGYLLPEYSELTEKNTKRKTCVKRKTINPKFVEYFEYKVAKTELDGKILWLSVWDHDDYGIHLFLGEVYLQLTKLDLEDCSGYWYQLKEWNTPVLGKFKLGLLLEICSVENGVNNDKLHVYIYGTEDLQVSEYTQYFVKVALNPDMPEKQTKVVQSGHNPIWNEELVFDDVSRENLPTSHYLEVQLFGLQDISNPGFIGGLRIGPSPDVEYPEDWMDSSVEEAQQWENMHSCPGLLIEGCHALRMTMEYGNDVNLELEVYRGNIIEDQVAIKKSRLRPVMSQPTHSRRISEDHSSDFFEDKIFLVRKDHQKFKDSNVVGSLNISLMLEKRSSPSRLTPKGKFLRDETVTLHVFIDDCEELQCSDYVRLFVKVVLMPDCLEKQTKTIEADDNIVWVDILKFKNLSLKRLCTEHFLEIELYSVTSSSVAKHIGGFCLGSFPTSGVNVESGDGKKLHWQEMLSCPNDWIDYCHEIEHSMVSDTCVDPDLSSIQDSFSEDLHITRKSKMASPPSSAFNCYWESIDKGSIDLTPNVISSLGCLILGLMYENLEVEDGIFSNVLYVSIEKAAGLAVDESCVLGKYFVKLSLLPLTGSRQTMAVNYKNGCANWYEDFSYPDISLVELSVKHVLELTLWESDRSGNVKPAGGLRIGPALGKGHAPEYLDCTREEANHWEKMLSRPSSWVKYTHMLRPLVEYGKIGYFVHPISQAGPSSQKMTRGGACA